MEQSEGKKGPERKTRVGRFQVSLWRTKRTIAAKNDFEAEREFVSRRACVQHSRMNQQSGIWENQQVWCSLEELRDLAQALDKFGDEGV